MWDLCSEWTYECWILDARLFIENFAGKNACVSAQRNGFEKENVIVLEKGFAEHTRDCVCVRQRELPTAPISSMEAIETSNNM